MAQDREAHICLSEYCEKSVVLIRETLTNTDEDICSKLGYDEHNLIAEFAATFSIQEWALEHGWTYTGRSLTKQYITWLDLINISKAHKAGASIRNTINLDGTGYAYIWLAEVFSFKADFPSLMLNNRFYDHGYCVRLIAKALQSGLKLNRLTLGGCCGEDIRLFFEAIPTPTKLNGLKIWHFVRNRADEYEVVRLIFEKLESGRALQNLELLNLSCSAITNEDVEFIACALRAGVKLKKLDLSNNRIGNEGAILLAGAIQQAMNLDLQYIFMYGNQIDKEAWAALKEAQKITRVMFCQKHN